MESREGKKGRKQEQSFPSSNSCTRHWHCAVNCYNANQHPTLLLLLLLLQLLMTDDNDDAVAAVKR